MRKGSTAERKAQVARLRAEQARKHRQQRLLAITAIGVVLVVLAVGIAVAVANEQSKSRNRKALEQAKAGEFIKTLETIPAATFNAVGAGAATNFGKAMEGPALTKNGLPRVIYYGAEFCPYCGMQRWPMVAAFARFGTWEGLKPSLSSENETVANVPTVSFQGAKFTSKYFSFTGYEVQDRDGAKIAEPPAADMAIWNKVNEGGYPTTVIGGKIYSDTPEFDGSWMANANSSAIAAQLSNPKASETQAIIGAANVVTAQVCRLTNQQPANVCTSPGVTAAGAKVPKVNN